MRNLLIGLITLGSLSAFAAYDCQLKTPFDGTYVGKSSTELEAKRAAVKDCEDKLGRGDFWCKEEKVKCEKISAKLCLLKTPFDGTFEGYASTDLEAKRAAVKNCEAKLGNGDFWCKEEKTVCSDL